MKKDDLKSAIKEESLLLEKRRIAADKGYASMCPMLVELSKRVPREEYNQFVVSLRDHNGKPRSTGWAKSVLCQWGYLERFPSLLEAVRNGEVSWTKAHRAARLAEIEGNGTLTVEERDKKALYTAKNASWGTISMNLSAARAERKMTIDDSVKFLPRIGIQTRRDLIEANRIIHKFKRRAGEQVEEPDPDLMTPIQLIERVSHFIIDLADAAKRGANGQEEAHEERS